MKKKILFVLGLLLIIIPFFINRFSFYRIICVFIGIMLFAISIIKKKTDILWLPILLILIYGIDYLQIFIKDLKPIFVIENKVNDKVTLYNSVFYRIYKCENYYMLDNNYNKSFPCDPKLINNIDINQLLNETHQIFKKYKYDVIKVTGKISKVNGASSLEMQEYQVEDNSINGYVNFKEEGKLIIKIDDKKISNYKVYDYITVVGILEKLENNVLIMKDAFVVVDNKYDKYNIEVIVNDECHKDFVKYMDNYYTKCINNIYINYGFDKYELSYVIQDEKVKIDKLLEDLEYSILGNNKLYELNKFNIIKCGNGKNYLLNKEEDKSFSICEN